MTQKRKWLSNMALVLALAIVAYAMSYAYRARVVELSQAARTQLFRDMIATTDHGLIIINPDGRIVEWGPGAEKIFGWKADEVTGSKLDFLMGPAAWKTHSAAIEARKDAPYAHRSLVTVSCWAFCKDGSKVNVHVVVSSFKNHIGYYHVGLITREENVRSAGVLPPPGPDSCPPAPKPQHIEYTPEGTHFTGG